jgi:hypothetical protein
VSGYPAYKVIVMHVAPVFLDTEATVSKTCSLGALEEPAERPTESEDIGSRVAAVV